MSNNQRIQITDSEWEVMRVLWAQENCSSQEIIQILQQKTNWQPTTIKTLLSRLVKKELVTTQKNGRAYIYRPLVTGKDSWQEASNLLYQHTCARKMGERIALLIQNSTLSVSDIKHLKKTLSQKEKEAILEVPCDCIPGQCRCEDCC